jgi:hypothetical protein
MAGLFNYLSFSYINDVIAVAASKSALELQDVPDLVDADTCGDIHATMQSETNCHKHLKWKVYEITKSELWNTQIFQLISSSLLYVPPLALKSILAHIDSIVSAPTPAETISAGSPSSSSKNAITSFTFSVPVAVALLFLGPLLKSICDGQIWNRSRRVVVRTRAAIIALIYSKTLHVDLSAVTEGPGSLNNLISVDAGEAAEFTGYIQFLWCTPYEASVCLTLLFLVLGPSALAGVFLMVLSMPLWTLATRRMHGYQKALLKNKVRTIGLYLLIGWFVIIYFLSLFYL